MMLQKKVLLSLLITLVCVSPSLAQDASNASSASPTPSTQVVATPEGTTSAVPSNTPNNSGNPSSSIVGSVTGSATGSGSSSSPSPTSIDGQPGRLILTQPQQVYQQPSMFGIGSAIQFKWKYDQYLTISPEFININVFRPSLNLEIPIAVNLSGSTTEWTWDTKTWNQTVAPLVEGSDYQLRFFDERGPKATWVPGRLAMTLIPFKMYKPSDGPVCTVCVSLAAPQKAGFINAGVITLLALAMLV